MCGRYSLNPNASAEISQLILRLQENNFPIKTGEIFPTDTVLVFIANENQNIEATAMSWGFDSFQKGRKHINARAETVLEKSTFREPFLKHRCIFLTTGFYEWDNQKKKNIFKKSDSEVLYLAGFYQKTLVENQAIILTTASNASVEKVHDRMPLILDRSSISAWLNDINFAIEHLKKSMPELIQETIVLQKYEEIDLFEE